MPKSTFLNLPADKRQRIERAAIRLFGTLPYGQATLDEIAREAGISKGSLYQYFSGKSDLYRYLLLELRGQEKMLAIAKGYPGPNASVWEVFEHAFLQGFSFSMRDPEFTRMAIRFLKDFDQDPELAAIARDNREQSHAWVRGLLEQGRGVGDVGAEVDLDIATPIVARALGEGSIDLIAGIMGQSVERFMEHPELAEKLSDEALREGIAKVLSILEYGLRGRGGE